MKPPKKPHFQKIGLIGKQRSAEALETLKTLKAYLVGQKIEIILEEKTSASLLGQHFQAAPLSLFPTLCDLAIVIGGDGNLLSAARTLALGKLPVLGINRGNLGFLTDINPHSIEEQLGPILQGQYHAEKRFLLATQMVRQKITLHEGNALNDVVLSQGGIGKMIEFEVYIHDQFVYSVRADGLIATTPTGSTAYALSANGPILHPELDAIALVPMFPHTLSSRPIVVKGDSSIKIVVAPHNQVYPRLSCDSQIHFSVAPGDEINIYKQKEQLTLIHPLDYCYYKTLRNKLQWGQKL